MSIVQSVPPKDQADGSGPEEQPAVIAVMQREPLVEPQELAAIESEPEVELSKSLDGILRKRSALQTFSGALREREHELKQSDRKIESKLTGQRTHGSNEMQKLVTKQAQEKAQLLKKWTEERAALTAHNRAAEQGLEKQLTELQSEEDEVELLQDRTSDALAKLTTADQVAGLFSNEEMELAQAKKRHQEELALITNRREGNVQKLVPVFPAPQRNDDEAAESAPEPQAPAAEAPNNPK